MTPCDWLNKGYSFNMAAVVVTSGRCGFRIELRHSNQPNKLSLCSCYFHFNILFKQLHISYKTDCFSYKGGCAMHGYTCIGVFKKTIDKWPCVVCYIKTVIVLRS